MFILKELNNSVGSEFTHLVSVLFSLAIKNPLLAYFEPWFHGFKLNRFLPKSTEPTDPRETAQGPTVQQWARGGPWSMAAIPDSMLLQPSVKLSLSNKTWPAMGGLRRTGHCGETNRETRDMVEECE